MSSPTQADTMDRNELAQRLGVSLTTLKRRRLDGSAPPPLQMHGHPRWARETVEKFLANDPVLLRGTRRKR